MARGRILHVLQPSIGGVPAYVAMLARGMAARDWEVVVAGPVGAPAFRGLPGAGVDLVDLEVARAPEPRRDAAAVAQLARLARRRRVDLVHAHSSKASVLGALSARAAGVASVYTPHAWAFQMRHVLPVRLAVAGTEAALSRLHARIITGCHAEAAAAHRWGVARAGQLRTVHTGLPTSGADVAGLSREDARTALAVEPDQVVVAWVGRRGAQKRPEQLAGLAARLPHRAVVFALGHGLDEDPGLERRLRSAGVRVLTREDRADGLFAAADLFVLTSAWEGFPLAVLEAMRAGLPVVGYAVGGLAEQVEDGVTGRLVEPDDVRGLADRTAELVADPQGRRRMSSLAEVRSRQRFPLEAMLDGVEQVYGELLESRSVSRHPAAS